MDATVVLVHSPSVGPLTWAPVAARLNAAGVRAAGVRAAEARAAGAKAAGVEAIVPSLLGVADSTPPFWPAVAEIVRGAIDRLPPDRPVVLVAHSNAGVFVPVIVEAAPRRVAGCLFVDAALPAVAGPTPIAPPELLDFLRPMVTDGRLPQWTAWWDEADVAPMFPDEATRSAVSAEQPRLPLSYYQERVPAPEGWDDRPCGYLLFGSPYEAMAADARARGWAVSQVPGEHLHQVVDPDAVTERILAMISQW
jgi:pimeloyl-ACP methyl ester carboxylesterase